MKIEKKLFSIITLLFMVGCTTSPTKQPDIDLPLPPAGLTWYESLNGVGVFLKPEGWFVKEESIDNSNKIFISKENFDTNGRFLTGMSVNQLNDWSKSNNSTPSEYAQAFAAKATTTGEVLKNTVIKGNQEDMHAVRVLDDNNGSPTIAQHLAIGVDSEDQVYLITYESPESEWDANYSDGRQMLNYFFLGN